MPFAKTVDVDSVKRVLKNFLDAVLNPAPAPAKQTPVIQLWESGPKPLKPYASFKLTAPEKPAITDDLIIEGGDQFVAGQRVFHAEVQFFSDGEEATEMAEAVRTAFEQPQFYDIIEHGSTGLQPPADLAFQCAVETVRDPIDLTGLLETKYERRVSLEFDLAVTSRGLIDDKTPNRDGIKIVDMEGIATDGAGGEIAMDVKADAS
jgi:hypothetical protein